VEQGTAIGYNEISILKLIGSFLNKGDQEMDIRIRADVDPQDITVCRFTVDRPVYSGSAAFTNPEEAKS